MKLFFFMLNQTSEKQYNECLDGTSQIQRIITGPYHHRPRPSVDVHLKTATTEMLTSVVFGPLMHLNVNRKMITKQGKLT